MNLLNSHPRSFRHSGFTLVELLVVIGIIAILASVLMVSASAMIKQAQRTKLSGLATNLQTAVLSYYTEYSVYPYVTSTAPTVDGWITDASASAGNWKALIYGLSGNINPYDATTTIPAVVPPNNTRAIAFLTLKNSDVDVNGGPKNPLPPAASNPYMNIAFDYDYDGILPTTTATVCMPNFVSGVTATTMPSNSTNTGGNTTSGVAVWANCNGNTGTNPKFWIHTY